MTTRRALAAVLGAATLTAAGVAAPADAAVGGCVGGPGCTTSLQAAVDAARPGATIRIAAGEFAGGVHIAKSLRLVGAGAGRTVIRGGGPVLTIETPSGTPPTVVVSGLTVTGGVSHGPDPVNAFGGGILVAPGPDGAVGATVTLRHVVVRDNRTAPRAVSPSPSGVKCPDGDCPYAGSRGGGIASFGTLTIERSVVTGNRAGGTASDANGGGIWAAGGTLTIRSSVVSHNAADPAKIGRFSEGGGIFAAGGTTTIERSSVTANTSRLVTSWPIRPQGVLLDLLANGGGVHIAEGGAVTVRDAEITGNRILASDPDAEMVAFGTGILVDDGSRVDIARTRISGNRLDVRTATAEDGPSGPAVEIDSFGTLTDVQVTGNSSTVTAVDGQAQAAGGFGGFADNPSRLVLTRVAVTGNRAVARSATSARVFGGGILNDALMDLRGVTVHGNTAAAYAPDAQAQGGGIWNGPLLVDQRVELTLSDSKVTGNTAIAGGKGARGGGIFNTGSLTLTRTVVARNRPDQCSGCS